VENYWIFNVVNTEQLPKKYPEVKLFTDILTDLRKSGIECKRVKSSYTLIAECLHNNIAISIAMFPLYETDNVLCGTIWCLNCPPKTSWWKRFFKPEFVHPNELGNGKELSEICEHVNNILAQNSHYENIKRMTYEEWNKKLGIFKET